MIADVLVIGGQQEHHRSEVEPLQPSCHLQAVHARQIHVHEDEVRHESGGGHQRLLTGRSQSDHPEPRRLPHNGCHGAQELRSIVDQ